MNTLLIFLAVYLLRDKYINLKKKMETYFSEYKEYKEGTNQVQVELVKEKAKSNKLNERLIELQEAAIAQNVKVESSQTTEGDKAVTNIEKREPMVYQRLVTPKVSNSQRTIN